MFIWSLGLNLKIKALTPGYNPNIWLQDSLQFQSPSRTVMNVTIIHAGSYVCFSCRTLINHNTIIHRILMITNHATVLHSTSNNQLFPSTPRDEQQPIRNKLGQSSRASSNLWTCGRPPHRELVSSNQCDWFNQATGAVMWAVRCQLYNVELGSKDTAGHVTRIGGG